MRCFFVMLLFLDAYFLSSAQFIQESKKNERHVALTLEYRQRIESELSDICQDAIQVLKTHLIPKAVNAESKVFYLKMCFTPCSLALSLAHNAPPGLATTIGTWPSSRATLVMPTRTAPRAPRSLRTRRPRTSPRRRFVSLLSFLRFIVHHWVDSSLFVTLSCILLTLAVIADTDQPDPPRSCPQLLRLLL